MMDVQFLRQADMVLSKCGRPVAPAGMSAVCFYRGIPVQAVFPIAPAALSQTITKEISGDTTFLLRAISMTSAALTALRIQIQSSVYAGTFVSPIMVELKPGGCVCAITVSTPCFLSVSAILPVSWVPIV